MLFRHDNLACRGATGGDFGESDEALRLLRCLSHVLYAVRCSGRQVMSEVPPAGTSQLVGIVPAVTPESLGARTLCEAHGLRYPYVTGAMANGIASVELVVAMGRAGFLGFFGSGGLPMAHVEEAIRGVQDRLSIEPYGFNLLHNPFEPQAEMGAVELYVKHHVRRVEAAAFMEAAPSVVLFRSHGMRALPDGRIFAPNKVMAKVSRPEVASRFMAPPPEALLRELVSAGKLREVEARLAAQLPVAEDITCEADSGGHTDQRPLPVLLPRVLQERARAIERHGYARHGVMLHVGAAGGMGEPLAAHAAFAMGADYLVTGSINQASLQAGTSAAVKQMLFEADMADVAMAPAPDMFEMGARVQVLKRGTLYPQRAQKLFDLYSEYPNFESIPAAEREKVERQIFQRPFCDVWAETERYWEARDPAKAEKGRRDGKERMALCFRWYLGLSSRWATSGEPGRRYDYQVWCGPALAGFNRWARGTTFETLAGRDAPEMAKAILFGVCALVRRDAAARAGVEPLPTALEVSRPPLR